MKIIGEKVLILPSCALTSARLDFFAGREGTVIDIVKHNDKIIGYWVNFQYPYMNETEWFIPYDSI